jgi:hypothetical protein
MNTGTAAPPGASRDVFTVSHPQNVSTNTMVQSTRFDPRAVIGASGLAENSHDTRWRDNGSLAVVNSFAQSITKGDSLSSRAGSRNDRA